MEKLSHRRRPELSDIAFGLLIFSAFFLGANNLDRAYRAPYNHAILTPAILGDEPEGRDFRRALDSAAALKSGNRPTLPSLPLVSFAYVPWTFHPSYYRFTQTMILALFVALFASLRESRILSHAEAGAIALLLTSTFYHSYWFLFALERGSGDVFAVTMTALGLLSLGRGQRRAAMFWFTAATQWSLYPVVLGLLLVLRFGWPSFLRFLAVNAALPLVTGPGNLRASLGQIKNSFATANTVAPNFSLWGPLAGSEHAGLYLAACVVALGAFAFATLYEWWATRHIQSRSLAWHPLGLAETGLAGIAVQLVSLLPPVTSGHGLGLQVVPFLILVTRPRAESPEMRRTVKGITAVVAGALGALSAGGPQNRVSATVVGFLAYTVLAVMTLGTRRSPNGELKSA